MERLPLGICHSSVDIRRAYIPGAGGDPMTTLDEQDERPKRVYYAIGTEIPLPPIDMLTEFTPVVHKDHPCDNCDDYRIGCEKCEYLTISMEVRVTGAAYDRIWAAVRRVDRR